MFNLCEAIEKLYEMDESEGKPERIKITAYICLEQLDESLPHKGDRVIDEQTMEEWYDFASTIEGIIDVFGETINISLSKNPNSLSEYIDFYVYDKDGNKNDYLIDLRLSNHGQTTNAKSVRRKRVAHIDPKYTLESVVVNDSTFYSYQDAERYIRRLIAKHSYS